MVYKQLFALALSVVTLSASQPLRAQAISFTTLPSSTTQDLRGISFSDTAKGFACGTGGTILKTVNGGTTWTALTSGTTEDLWDIKVAPGTNGQKALAVGDNNTILKTSDGGSTWTAQTIPFASGSFVFGIQCLDSVNYFACGGDFGTFSGAVLKTTNGGTTWTKASVAGSVFLDKVFMLGATTGFTVGTNTSFTDGSIQKTTTGTTYTQTKTSPSVITNLWCNSATNIVAVGLAGQIWKTTNAGASWASTSFNATDLYGIQFRDTLRGFACGGSSSGSIVLSTVDGGSTWSQIPFSFSGALQSMCIIGNRIFVAGDAGMIAKAGLSPVTSVQDALVRHGSVILYPNPLRQDDLFLKLANTESALFSVAIMDVSGRVWSTQMASTDARKTGVVRVGVKGLPAGSYLLQVTDEKGGVQLIRFDRQ